MKFSLNDDIFYLKIRSANIPYVPKKEDKYEVHDLEDMVCYYGDNLKTLLASGIVQSRAMVYELVKFEDIPREWQDRLKTGRRLIRKELSDFAKSKLEDIIPTLENGEEPNMYVKETTKFKSFNNFLNEKKNSIKWIGDALTQRKELIEKREDEKKKIDAKYWDMIRELDNASIDWIKSMGFTESESANWGNEKYYYFTIKQDDMVDSLKIKVRYPSEYSNSIYIGSDSLGFARIPYDNAKDFMKAVKQIKESLYTFIKKYKGKGKDEIVNTFTQIFSKKLKDSEGRFALSNEDFLKKYKIPDIKWESVSGKRSMVYDVYSHTLSKDNNSMSRLREYIKKFGKPLKINVSTLPKAKAPQYAIEHETEWDGVQGQTLTIEFEGGHTLYFGA
ncbi:MAG: hypothetical protein MJZ34_04960 [Paludibacteraceae bacterium]|nr:hypothetical protein [Paludibacteraceae bacterium]